MARYDAIPVHVPETRKRRWRGQPVSMYTELFRQGANLDEALRETYARHPQDQELRVISAGCSVGAEPDTILALHRQAGRETRMRLVGVDVNKRAIKAARTGHYVTGLFRVDDYRPALLLESGGFASKRKYSGYRREDVQYTVDSRRVRRGHDVTFVKSNITDVSLPPADLVMANNVLYHLEPEEATAMADHLAGLVAPEGVLSFGGIGRSKRMTGEKGSAVYYSDWLAEAGEMLATKHGLAPLPTEAANVPFLTQPTMFRRD